MGIFRIGIIQLLIALGTANIHAQLPTPIFQDSIFDQIGVTTHGNWWATRNDSSIYLYQKSNAGWALADSFINSNVRYGFSIAIEDTLMVISDMGDSADHNNSGNLYFYGFEKGKWTLRQQFMETGPMFGGFNHPTYWGYQMDLHNHLVAVAYPKDTIMGAESGSVHIFRYNGSRWYREHIIRPPARNMGIRYGWGLAAYGSKVSHRLDYYNSTFWPIHIWSYGRGGWALEDTLPNFDQYLAAWEWDMYKHTLATGRDTADGSVRIYQYNATQHQWPLVQVLYPDNPVYHDDFGQTVALYDRWLYTGAPRKANRGSVYIAKRDTQVYALKYEIFAPLSSGANRFGLKLAAYGNHLMVYNQPWESSHAYGKSFLYDLCAFPSIRGKERDVFCEGDSIYYEAGCAQDSVVWHTAQGVIGTGSRIGLQAIADDSVWIALYYDDTLRGYDTVRYQVIQKPIAKFTSDTTCVQDSVAFSNLPHAPATWRYYWDFTQDGFHEDTTRGHSSYTFDSAGVYPVRLNIVTEGCIVSYVDTAVVEECVGKERTDASSIRIYPNPATNQITVELPSADFEWLIITNSLGEQVRQIDLRGLRSRTLAVDWPAGIYFFSFCSKNQVLPRQVVVGF